MRRTFITGILTVASLGTLHAQQADSLLLSGEAFIGQRLEHIEEIAEAEVDLSEIRESLDHFMENPLNINTAEKQELRSLGLLNDMQIKNLTDYRRKYGPFLSIFELMAIEGFSRNTIEKLMPFTINGNGSTLAGKNKSIFEGRHDIIMRLQRKLVSQEGYTIPPDSLQAGKGSSFYLGNPYRFYLRYRYEVKNRLSLGLTAEKDPGEMFLTRPDALDSIQLQSVGKPYGFDFYSAHIQLTRAGIFESIILGDYHIQCGQGLVLWSGLSYAGGSDPSGFKRYTRVIKPNSSANENQFMRGIALRMRMKKLSMSIFYSRKYIDAIIRGDDPGNTIVTSMPESGYHRTLNELNGKNVLLTTYYGGHLSFSNNRLKLGLTAFKTSLGIGIRSYEDAVKRYDFSGRENFNAGMDFEWLARRTVLFGEFGISLNGGFAGLAGLTHNTVNGSVISILFREYRRDYQSFMSSAPGRRDGNANERGLKLALEVPLPKAFTLHLFTEHFSYPFLIPGNINIVRGHKHEASLSWKAPNGLVMGWRYRYDRSLVNESNSVNWLDKMHYEWRQRMRIMANYNVSPAFSMKVQLEYLIAWSDVAAGSDKGSLLALDMHYHPISGSLKLSWRYALFNTGSYASRLFAYEHDVLYASSMPAYYGKGFRTYMLIRYSPAKWLDAWLRLALTIYTDRSIISSGPEQINGNKLPEMKIQCRIKL